MKKKDTLTLITPAGETFLNEKPAIPWNEYPRPHLKRDSFFCLNGEWELSIRTREKSVYDGAITVPFAPQSHLSGVNMTFCDCATLYYRREFSLPEGFIRDRVILHFGAVDQVAKVILNGVLIGTHEGGYDSFSFDVTEHIGEVNVLEVEVADKLNEEILPYGKQKHNRGGMWYTPVSGIWQTVWLESVPLEYAKEIKIKTDASGAEIEIVSDSELCGSCEVLGKTFEVHNGQVRIDIDQPQLWSPENPYLYDVKIKVGEDEFSTYFAIRTLEIRDLSGKNRLCLNGSPYFFHGLLDQGYFSDGIFLPATPEGFADDILLSKRLGFNMLRKHIKVEPELFYYYCDKLGMVVFQDMVNNSDYSFFRDTALPTIGIKRLSDKIMHRNKKSREAFLRGMESTVERVSFHPSVCYYTIFNEGWGQFSHASAYERLRALDDSRFIDSVSGWFMPLSNKKFSSDVESLHVYFKPVKLKGAKSGKPIVLSEFGGYSYKVEGHCFNLSDNYGYRTYRDRKSFREGLLSLYRSEVIPLVKEGLCAAVYTQLSDVEDETNGLITYDRRVVKVDEAEMRAIAEEIRNQYMK